MVRFITLYAFLVRKEKKFHVKNYLIINNWIQGIYQGNYSGGIGYFKDNKRCGIYYDWYSNGQLSIKCYYENNKYHGLCYYWCSNGQLWIKCYYKNNKYHGPCYYWCSNEQLLKKSIM